MRSYWKGKSLDEIHAFFVEYGLVDILEVKKVFWDGDEAPFAFQYLNKVNPEYAMTTMCEAAPGISICGDTYSFDPGFTEGGLSHARRLLRAHGVEMASHSPSQLENKSAASRLARLPSRLRFQTLPSIVHQHAEERPEAVAIVVWDEGDGVTLQVSFKQLSENVRAASSMLQHTFGLMPGDQCVLHSHNSIAYVCAALGAMEISATAVNLNWRLPDDINVQLLEQIDAKLLLASKHFGTLAKRVQQEQPGVHVVFFENICALPLHGTLPFRTAVPLPRPHPHRVEQPAVVFFTGGTTGTPKAVLHTHTRHAPIPRVWLPV